MRSLQYIDWYWNCNINGSLLLSCWGCKMARISTTCQFEIFDTFFVSFFSFILMPVIFSNFHVFFYYIINKRVINTARTRWFYFWSEVHDLICKYRRLGEGYCLRWKTLSSPESFKSKRVEVFDHSQVPVVFALSETGSLLRNSEKLTLFISLWYSLSYSVIYVSLSAVLQQFLT